MKNEMIMLSNLNCPSCASDLQKAVRKIGGVKRADVTFATGMLELEYDEAVVTPDTLQRVIESFGLGIASKL